MLAKRDPGFWRKSGPAWPCRRSCLHSMRSVEEAITRALCLAAVVTRAHAEYLIGSGEPGPVFVELMGVEVKDAPSRIDRWISQEGLKVDLSPQEQLWMSLPVGKWSEQRILNASWRRECLTVLLW